MPLLSFLSSIFRTLSSFPLLLEQPPHSTTMFSYVCMCLLTFHICAVLFPSFSFSLLPVFIYIKVFPLHFTSSTLSLTMLFYSLCVFSSLSFHRHTLGSNFLCHLFVVLNCMSNTNNLCFGTHSVHTVIW